MTGSNRQFEAESAKNCQGVTHLVDFVVA